MVFIHSKILLNVSSFCFLSTGLLRQFRNQVQAQAQSATAVVGFGHLLAEQEID